VFSPPNPYGPHRTQHACQLSNLTKIAALPDQPMAVSSEA
jgi:hypothetical protein